MIAIEVIGGLVALPLFVAAIADWYWSPEAVRRRLGPIAAMRALPLRPNRRRS